MNHRGFMEFLQIEISMWRGRRQQRYFRGMTDLTAFMSWLILEKTLRLAA
jgi:hypothetical protein